MNKYFIDNYNSLIPHDTSIDFNLFDSVKKEYNKDYNYDYGYPIYDNDRHGERDPVYLNTKLKQRVWIGSTCYNVHYDIYWSINEFPEEKYYYCRRSTCYKNIDLSFNHWCKSCHGAIEDMKVSMLVKIYILGEECDRKLSFGQIIKFINRIEILEYNEIVEFSNDEQKSSIAFARSAEICHKINERHLALQEAEKKTEDLRKSIEHIYAEFGFTSNEEMELFMRSTHETVEKDLVAKTREKIATLSLILK
jgi:hypothetical protein